jgi:hypothetical protein
MLVLFAGMTPLHITVAFVLMVNMAIVRISINKGHGVADCAHNMIHTSSMWIPRGLHMLSNTRVAV